jgi:hypothetical protein
MQLDQAKIRRNSMDANGRLLDYNNGLISLVGHYYTDPHSNVVYKITNFYYDDVSGKFIREVEDVNNPTEKLITSFDNNLYSIWQAFGGA